VKKVLAIISSPRKLGNCEIMAKEISRHITEPHDLQFLHLPDFNILPCKGCYLCLVKNKGCVLRDDFQTVADALIEADALIVSAPAYFLGPNSCLKRFIDRGLALYSHAEEMWGKPAVGIGIAGIEGKEGYTLLGIQSFLKLLFTEVKQTGIAYGALPGEIFLNDTNKLAAKELGSALFGPARKITGPSCPLCGGDTFRFLGDNRVRCVLCSNTGTISTDRESPVFHIEKDRHGFFLTLEDALNHREWLVGMRSRFIRHKDRLKKITLDYGNEGKRITPQRV
jgi:multimeric flavodoxin WrbA